MLLNRFRSPIPRPQSLIITPPFRPSPPAFRTTTLKPTPHLPNPAFSLFAKGAPSRLRNASPILVFAILVTSRPPLSFTRAARQRNVSQPALSHSISQLEERLGNKFFERSVRGIRLTPVGRVFEKTAQRVLREIRAGAQVVAESTGLIAGEIRLGFVNSVNICWLPMMIGRFLRKYPQVRFSVESIGISELERRLLDERLDIGVGFLEGSRQSLRTVELFVENLVVVANAKLVTKTSRALSLEELAKFPLVLLRTGFCTRELIDEGLNRIGIRPNILAEFDSIDAIVSCVQEVAAISVLPEHACH